jgi:hypothetical protein
MKLALLMTLFISAVAHASCESKATNYAVRVYEAAIGPVQGSEGMEHETKLVSTRQGILDYLVTIWDNNEDGEIWEVEYQVVVDNKTGACRKVLVKMIATREL